MRNYVSVVGAGALLAVCLSAAEARPYDGPTAPPQVVYRIDAHRHFEIVPRLNYACVRANLNYVDTKRGIRSHIPGWDRMETRAELVIDAASDQYLIGPVAGMDADCAPDAHPAHCASFIVYSRDAGRTWEITKQLRHREYNGPVRLIGGSVYYAGHRAKVADLVAGDSAWTEFRLPDKTIPPLGKPPIDTVLHCDNSKTIPRKYD